MMRFEGALVTEQGVKFAIVVVKRYVVQNGFEANKFIRSFQRFFDYIPIILMAQDAWGTPIYYGRQDIVNFLVDVPVDYIPWQEFSIS